MGVWEEEVYLNVLSQLKGSSVRRHLGLREITIQNGPITIQKSCHANGGSSFRNRDQPLRENENEKEKKVYRILGMNAVYGR